MTMTTKELLALVGKWRERGEAVSSEGGRVYHIAADELAPIATALCADVEAMRKDAERYRWLREQVAALEISVEWCVGSYSLSPSSADELDAAIDAARSRNEHEG